MIKANAKACHPPTEHELQYERLGTMTLPELTIPKYVSLKNHASIDERWLQHHLENNITLLGMGDLEIRDRERRQPTGGRLDLLLHDSEQGIRYEVEIQLGAVDESHIIRTIEYWDVERRRYPLYEHIAVIVAEDVTSRFLNVISILNGTVPLIAIQIKGVEVNDAFTLIATRVLDVVRQGTEEEDAGETVDRLYWEQKASPESQKTVDDIVGLVNELLPGVEPRYNKHYIGLTYNSQARNFVVFHPKKKFVWAEFKTPEDEDLSNLLDDSRLTVGPYNSRFNQYRVKALQNDHEESREILLKLIKKARDSYSRL